MASVGSLPFAVNTHRVAMGGVEIPIGEVKSIQIQPEQNTVLLWCHGGAMGSNEEVLLDFQIDTSQRVQKFVRGIWEKTNAFFIRVKQLNTQVVVNQDLAYVTL